MPTKILVGINGTRGPNDSIDYYTRYMKQSFVWQIADRSSIANIIYEGGPDLPGLEDGTIYERASQRILDQIRSVNPDEGIEIYMAGYSRGAMLCLAVANRLYRDCENAGTSVSALTREQANQITIKKMLLLDPVTMDVTSGKADISEFGIVPPFVESVLKLATHPSLTRWYFVRELVITIPFGKTQHSTQYFDCTHSAIGGLPGEGDNIEGHTKQIAMSTMRTSTEAYAPSPSYPLEADRAAPTSEFFDHFSYSVPLTAPLSLSTRPAAQEVVGVTVTEDDAVYTVSVLPVVNGYLPGFEVTELVPFQRAQYPLS